MTIAPRFLWTVQAHLLANHMACTATGTPLILAIHGRPGSGKTFQLSRSLTISGATVTSISASDLESDRANDPAKLLRRAYDELSSSLIESPESCAALIINDIDTALGDWGTLVQTTVNRQMVIGELLNICDFPNGNGHPLRVPIIITANDLTKLYGPLLRPGRTRIFHWSPNATEIHAILTTLFHWLPEADIKELIRQVGGDSIARYVDLYQIAVQSRLRSTARRNFAQNIARARSGNLRLEVEVGLRELIAADAEIALATRQTIDYSKD